MVTRRIGFADFPAAWDGPFELHFEFVSTHARVVRFRARLETHGFDLYGPKFMLPGGESGDVPAWVAAVLSTTPGLGPIGFARQLTPPAAGPEVCVYEYSEEKVNSHRFDRIVEGQRYSLYVPKEVFGPNDPPRQIALELGFPQ